MTDTVSRPERHPARIAAMLRGTSRETACGLLAMPAGPRALALAEVVRVGPGATLAALAGTPALGPYRPSDPAERSALARRPACSTTHARTQHAH